MFNLLKPKARLEVGPNADAILSHWHRHKGHKRAFQQGDMAVQWFRDLMPYCFMVRPDEGHGLLFMHMGEDILNREEGAISEYFLDLFEPNERGRVHSIYTAAGEVPCAVAGTVARRPIGGGPVFFRSFLNLPVLDNDGKVDHFINVDDAPDYRALKYVEIQVPYLSQNMTTILEYEYVDLGFGTMDNIK